MIVTSARKAACGYGFGALIMSPFGAWGIIHYGVPTTLWTLGIVYLIVVVAAWLCGIIINLLLLSGYYDIALRDFGLALGAIALGRLSMNFDR